MHFIIQAAQTLLALLVIFGFFTYRNRLRFKIEWELLREGRPDLVVALRQEKKGPWSTFMLGVAAFISALAVHAFIHSGGTKGLGGPLSLAGIFLVLAAVGQYMDKKRR